MQKSFVILASINLAVFVIAKFTGGSMGAIIIFDILFIWYKVFDNALYGKD